jgi:hypothetical protein
MSVKKVNQLKILAFDEWHGHVNTVLHGLDRRVGRWSSHFQSRLL